MSHVDLYWKFHESEGSFVLLCGERLFGTLEMEQSDRHWKVKAQAYGQAIRKPRRSGGVGTTPTRVENENSPLEQKKLIEQLAVDFFKDCFGNDCEIVIDDASVLRAIQNI